MNYYKLLETYYIGNAVRHAGEVVCFNDNPAKGGMRPGKGMVPCDVNGTENQVKAPRRSTAAAAAEDIG